MVLTGGAVQNEIVKYTQELTDTSLFYIWFGIPFKFYYQKNEETPKMDLALRNENNEIVSVFKYIDYSLPLFGIKYDIAILTHNEMIKKYAIGEIIIMNKDIDIEDFTNNLNNALNTTDPLLLTFSNTIGGKNNNNNNNKKNTRKLSKKIMKKYTKKNNKQLNKKNKKQTRKRSKKITKKINKKITKKSYKKI